ncbi:protein GLUTAMINE DUMPER 5-like [Musa acuminata AAA Group]|uniref:protein GLUTAMINE DUMPER 5-like n=1 Tax=Musa acuminata AAA Group TaxID=214697 RepID=UPI0031CEE672
MRPAGSSSSPSSGLQPWRSPLPYLFGGVAAMMGLIAVALLVLACTRHKSSEEDSTPPCTAEKPVVVPLEMEPRVVVVMAGDDVPTFIANPLPPVACDEQRA